MEVDSSKWGEDLPSVHHFLEVQRKLYKEVVEFRKQADHCVAAKHTLKGKEQQLYMQLLSKMETLYTQLLVNF